MIQIYADIHTNNRNVMVFDHNHFYRTKIHVPNIFLDVNLAL